MLLILLRHGIAEPHGTRPDEERELTPTGRRRIKEVARGLARLFPKVDAIYSSPLIRCVQTAVRVGKVYDLGVETIDALRPQAPPADFRPFLDGVKGRRIICVGHEPNLSAIMRDLAGLEGEIELKKGGSYGVRIGDDGAGRLEWMVVPRLLR